LHFKDLKWHYSKFPPLKKRKKYLIGLISLGWNTNLLIEDKKIKDKIIEAVYINDFNVFFVAKLPIGFNKNINVYISCC